MINDTSFKLSVVDTLKLLKGFGIYKGKGDKAIGDHSEEFKKASRGNRHTDIYQIAIKNNDYEVLLYDDSIFQFGIKNNIIRYAFIQNPQHFFKKDDYLSSIYGADELLTFSEEDLIGLLDSIQEDEYEQFLNEQDLNLESHIIRYDLDLKGYDPLIHSCSHIHIGLNPNLRIPCSKILTPLQFAIFAMKHTYYGEWKKAIKDNEKMEKLIAESKKKCKNVPPPHWVEKEKYELYLI